MKVSETGQKSVWQKTPYANLLRYKPSSKYFARLRIRGKLIRRCLKTPGITVAKLRLADLEKEERQRAEHQSAVGSGTMSFADALSIYRQRLQADASLKPRSKVYREYQPTIYSLYTALNFLGQNITFISERQLAQGKAAKVQWLLVPNASHVLATTRPALVRFVKSGGKVLLVGKESLQRDEYNRLLEGSTASYPSFEMEAQEEATAAVLRKTLRSIRFEDLHDNATRKAAWGIEFRVVRNGAKTLVPIINLNKEPKTVQFPGWADRHALDLLSGEQISLRNFHIEPMLPRLLQVPN